MVLRVRRLLSHFQCTLFNLCIHCRHELVFTMRIDLVPCVVCWHNVILLPRVMLLEFWRWVRRDTSICTKMCAFELSMKDTRKILNSIKWILPNLSTEVLQRRSLQPRRPIMFPRLVLKSCTCRLRNCLPNTWRAIAFYRLLHSNPLIPSKVVLRIDFIQGTIIKHGVYTVLEMRCEGHSRLLKILLQKYLLLKLNNDTQKNTFHSSQL